MRRDFSIQSSLTVAQLLARWPATAAVFVRRGTGCVGCRLERFCTLEEVAASYSLSVETLLDDLQQCLRLTTKQRSEV